jgi:hypothetical protein
VFSTLEEAQQARRDKHGDRLKWVIAEIFLMIAPVENV